MGSGVVNNIHVRKIARHDQSIVAYKSLSRCSNTLLAVLGQWNIRYAGMAAIERPLRLTVTDNEDSGRYLFIRHVCVESQGADR